MHLPVAQSPFLILCPVLTSGLPRVWTNKARICLRDDVAFQYHVGNFPDRNIFKLKKNVWVSGGLNEERPPQL